jgi:hypothetical protein
MLKKLAKQRTIRRTEAEFEYSNGQPGEIKTETVSIEYYSPTIKEQKDRLARMKATADADPTKIVWQSEELAERLHALQDSEGERIEGKALTVDFLDGLDAKNLTAISAAIAEDLRPKEPASK